MRRIIISTTKVAQRAMSLSTRASSNLHPSKLGEVRSHCFRHQWDPARNPDGIIALAIAENKLMRDEITAHINANFSITPWHLTYGEGPSGSIALRTSISSFMNTHFKPTEPITKDHVVVCNGAGTAVSNLCFCLGGPGDGILLGRPYYTGFVPDIEAHSKFKLLGVAFGDIDPLSPDAVSCYEAALEAAQASGVHVRALLLANPHVS
jgi:aspartate/methionine/tyrosine aminotransferase